MLRAGRKAKEDLSGKRRGDAAHKEGQTDEMRGKQMETKERNTRHRMQSGSSAEQTASWCISGREELVSAEGCRQHYGNGCPAASLADCKQDLGKAYSLW